MNLEIKFENLDEKYIDDAVELVTLAYIEEKKAIPYLPPKDELNGELKELIGNLFKYGKGIVATNNGKLLGYLAGYKIDEFFGACKGIYCPLYGSGVNKDYRNNLFQEIYKHAANLWVNDSCFTHALTLFAHDNEIINQWFWLGFGLRCVDSIRKVATIDVNNENIKIKKADNNDIIHLAEIHRNHNLYYKTSPLFMPRGEEDPISDLTQWLSEDNHHLWVAYHNEKAVGYMRIQPDAETYISTHKSVMNITGAFVESDKRHSGIGAMLLGEIQNWLLENNYSLCGVDFESFNIMGSKFWNKYFTPYTYSLVRRIDERIKQ